MSDETVLGLADRQRIEGEQFGLGDPVATVRRFYAVPRSCLGALLVAGAALGALGDALLRVPGLPALNLFAWIAAVAVAAVAVSRRAGVTLDQQRVGWLATGVVLAAGLAWRDSPTLKLLTLGSAALSFALAAHRSTAAWVRSSGVIRYAGALALGALHTWAGPIIALTEPALYARRDGSASGSRWRRASAIGRGLAIAAPLLLVFGTLLMSADDVFANLVLNLVRFDFDRLGLHVVLFVLCAWVATGYLRGFLTTTDAPSVVVSPKRPMLGITEIATAVGAVDLLFLAFVAVQFRYLFGGDALVQITPDLTYAEYARHGFFELVWAVTLVVPVLLAADWLLDRRGRHDERTFRGLAGAQIGLVLVIAASALQRLRLYHDSYGLTESRLYAMALLLWIAVMLAWFGVTVLRGRRQAFAFGTLSTGLATLVLLFVVSPDDVVARANVTRMATVNGPARFDVAYATTLSADAVPALIEALPTLPPDLQCPLARHLLQRWPAEGEGSLRSWNWSASRAAAAIREHASQLRGMVGPAGECAIPPRS